MKHGFRAVKKNANPRARPSEISAPSATKSTSLESQRTSAFAGLAKIAASVFLYTAFMRDGTIQQYHFPRAARAKVFAPGANARPGFE